MPLRKIACAAVVLCLAAATAAHADQRSARHRTRGRGTVIVRPPIVAPRVIVRRPFVGARPVVRPFSRRAYGPVYRPGLGFGIYIGAPLRVAPYAYGYPAPYSYNAYGTYGYAYPAPFGYGYPRTAIVAAPPAGPFYGGVRLDVTPRDAAVYVDGYYAGIVDDFDGTWQRIALEPGPHHFEIEAPGHETLAFDVNVRPDQTVRYRGEMLRTAP